MAIVNPQPDDGCSLENERGLIRRRLRHLLERLLGQVDGFLQVPPLIGQIGPDGGRVAGIGIWGALPRWALRNLQDWFHIVQMPGKEQGPGVPQAEHGVVLAQVGG